MKYKFLTLLFLSIFFVSNISAFEGQVNEFNYNYSVNKSILGIDLGAYTTTFDVHYSAYSCNDLVNWKYIFLIEQEESGCKISGIRNYVVYLIILFILILWLILYKIKKRKR